MNFGGRLKYLRKNAQWTQKDLAKKADISSNSISKYEMGIAEPTLENLVKLAKIFDVSVDYLIGVGDDPTPVVPAGSSPRETKLDQDYVYLMGANGKRRKIYIPPEKTDRFRMLIESGFPELTEDNTKQGT